MKIAYLVSAYKNPILVKKTVEYLSCEDVAFFIHIDAKFPIAPFTSLRGKNVFFIDKRMPVYWAEFSFVEAQMLLIRQALAAPEHYDYFVLLGGSEFPLRSGRYIHDYIEKNRGREFITVVKVPAPGKPLARTNTLRFPSTRPVLRFLFRALAKTGLAQRDYRKYLGDLEAYSGNTWWALSREACEYIVEFSKCRPELFKFYENTHVPDESVFHTILGNSPLKSRIWRNLLFEEWPQEGTRHHPNLLTAEHVDYFESHDAIPARDLHGPGEMLFARKFSDDNLALVGRVAAMIARKENPPQPQAH
jgi:hypothetical protein